MTKGKTALIVGGGHNGIICGAYLSQAGFDVTILERNEEIGGGVALRRFADGYSVPGLAHIHHPLHPKIIRELSLPDTKTGGPGIKTISLSEAGEHILFDETSVSGESLSEADKSAFKSFKRDFAVYSKALGALYLNTPPRLKNFDFADGKTLAKLGWELRFGLGKKDMREFLRIGGMNVFDVLNEVFESDLLKGALGLQAVIGNHVGPRTPTTALNYLYSVFQEASGIAQPSSRTALFLQTLADTAGINIRTNAPVSSINVTNGRAVGVELADGEAIAADIVVSNADAKSTFIDLVGARELDALFVHRISKTRTDGDISKIHLALSGLPSFAGLTADQLSHRLLVSPDLRYVERSFNPSKYGELPDAPILDITIPTLHDPTLAPVGHHVMSINVGYTPYRLKMGWDAGRKQIYDTVLSRLNLYAPELESMIVAKEVLSPVDIESEFGVTGGHWHHGDMSIDQGFMMRPVHGAAQYQTPIDSLFLCGASAHPGGSITGLPGRNAARHIIAIGTS